MTNDSNGRRYNDSSSLFFVSSLLLHIYKADDAYQTLQSSHNVYTNLNWRERAAKSCCSDPKASQNEHKSLAIDISELSTEQEKGSRRQSIC